MKKRKSIILLSIVMLLLVVGVVSVFLLTNRRQTANTGNKADIDWYTEDGKEFVITTVDQLYGLVKLSQYYDFSGQTIKLGADIVVNEGNAEDWAKKAPKKKWFPIDGFAGKFDGQGHTISGIYGYGADTVAGLFSNTKTKANIRDFKLINSYFKVDGSSPVGSIVSNGCGTVEKVYSNAVITSNGENVGGIVGQANYDGKLSAIGKTMKIINCWFDGSLNLTTKTGRYGGGIVGLVSGGTLTVSHCLNSGNISCQSKESNGLFVGGIFGALANANNSGAVLLEDSLNVGKVETLKTTATGSIAGSKDANVSWNIADTYATEQSCGSVCTKQSGTTEGGVPQINADFVNGKEWYRWTTLDFDTYWEVTEDSTPVLKCFADEVIDTSGLTKAYNLNWYVEGRLEQVISTKEDLYGFALLSYSKTFEGQNIVLGNDIVVNEGKASDWAKGNNTPKDCWIPIGRALAFQGNFDGKGHTVSGLYAETTATFMGLFGWTGKFSEIKNVSVKNSYFKSTEASSASLGSITGRLEGKIDTAYSDAILSGTGALLGGIAGYKRSDHESKITNCWYDGTINMVGDKGKYVGGITGRLISGTLEIDNCLFSGKIHIGGQKRRTVSVGGFIGMISAGNVVVNGCLNSGQFELTETEKVNAVGRIFGQIADSDAINVTITSSYVTKVGYNGDYYYYRNGDKQTIKGGAELKEIKHISGRNGYCTTELDFSKYWAIVVNEDGTPILKSFAKKVPSVAGLEKIFDKSWYNPDKDTYILKDRQDLYGFAYLSNSQIDFKGKKIVLSNDIQVHAGSAVDWSNSTNTPRDVYNWNGIGKYTAFAGNFDGQGHTISGLYGVADVSRLGLFATVGADGIVQNLRLVNTYFGSVEIENEAVAAVGSIAGRCEGSIRGVYSDAILASIGNNNGGIIGYKNSDTESKITNCWFAGTIQMLGDDSKYSGGIVGRFYKGTLKIDNCLFSGKISIAGKKRSTSTGGFVGLTADKLIISSCLNSGVFEVTEAEKMDSVGRVFGQIKNDVATSVVLKDTYVTTEGYNPTNYWYCEGDKPTIEQGAELKDKESIMGYGGYCTTSLDFDKYWTVVVNEDETPILKSFADNVPSVAGLEKIFDKSWYNPKEDIYVLENEKDLYGFAYLSNSRIDFKGKRVVLANDIQVHEGSAVDWSNNTNTPVGFYNWSGIGKNTAFSGNFDGQGHTISGLYGVADLANLGLFATVGAGGIVQNLRLTNTYFGSVEIESGAVAAVGSIAGRCEGSISGAYSDAILASIGNNNGGIVGYKNSDTKSKIANCWFAGTIQMLGDDSKYSGGIVGRFYKGTLEIDNCLFSGKISIEGKKRTSSTGGFVGMANHKLTIKNSLNSGVFEVEDLNGMNALGRIFGQISNDKKANIVLENVYFTNKGIKGNNNWYCSGNLPTIVSDYYKVEEEDIIGHLGYYNTALDFAEKWAIVIDNEATADVDESGTPILKSFADVTSVLPQIPENVDISWYDFNKDTYKLSDAKDLRGLSYLIGYGLNFAGKTVELDQDIVLNKGKGTVTKWQEDSFVGLEEWMPIGSTTVKYAGIFDGCNHSIKGLYVDSDEQGVGLFASTAEGSTIKNLKIENSYFKSSAYRAGSVVGSCGGNLENVYSNATVVSTTDIAGGLIGQIWNGSDKQISISRCWYDGEMFIYRNSGGIIGVIAQGNVLMEDCLNTGNIDYNATGTGNKWIGGLCGRTYGYEGEWINTGETTGTIAVNMRRCLNTGQVENSKNQTTGSVLGQPQKGIITVESVYATNESYVYDGSSSKPVGKGTVSGIEMVAKVDIEVSNNVSAADVKNTLSGLYNSGVWGIGSKNTPELVWVNILNADIGWYDKTKDVYTISTAKELNGLAYLCNLGIDFAGKTIELKNDIVLNENKGTVAEWKENSFAGLESWTPIGTITNKFAGVFDGKNFSIKGVYVDSSEQGVGLFCSTAPGSTIKNLKLENSYFATSNYRIGSVVASCGGNLENVYSNATVVSTTDIAGGLIGQIWNTSDKQISISRCWYDGEMFIYRNSGGIIGVIAQGNVLMEDCLNTGNIDYNATGTGNKWIGGLCGRTYGYEGEWINTGETTGTIAVNMRRCLNTGQVENSKNQTTGSVFGQPQKGTITVESVYATNESYVYDGNSSKPVGKGTILGIEMVGKDDIKVSGSVSASDVKNELKGFNFTTVWTIGTEGTPELKK